MAKAAAKAYKGVGMDGFIATWYAQNTGKNIEDYRKDARMLAEHIPAGAAILEVAPGPGYLAIELTKLGRYTITGLDISTAFVDIARKNAREAGVSVDFRHGNAAHMPFDDDTFDFIVCRAAFKNFAEPVRALDEMHRVLKPGRQALIIDLRGDVSTAEINQHIDQMGVGGLNKRFIKWTFKYSLIKRAYTKDSFRALVAQSRFETCQVREEGIGLEVWLERDGQHAV